MTKRLHFLWVWRLIIRVNLDCMATSISRWYHRNSRSHNGISSFTEWTSYNHTSLPPGSLLGHGNKMKSPRGFYLFKSQPRSGMALIIEPKKCVCYLVALKFWWCLNYSFYSKVGRVSNSNTCRWESNMTFTWHRHSILSVVRVKLNGQDWPLQESSNSIVFAEYAEQYQELYWRWSCDCHVTFWSVSTEFDTRKWTL